MNYTFLIAVELTCWSKVKKQFTFVKICPLQAKVKLLQPWKMNDTLILCSTDTL